MRLGFLKRWFLVPLALGWSASFLSAGVLFNGNFQNPQPSNFFYDGGVSPFPTSTAVPGWVMDCTPNSIINLSTDYYTGNRMIYVAARSAVLYTADAYRIPVNPLSFYTAVVNYDTISTATPFIFSLEWFDLNGNRISVETLALSDPNGPGLSAPANPSFEVSGFAPVNAVTAGVRVSGFRPDGSAEGWFDNFDIVPEPRAWTLLSGSLLLLLLPRRLRPPRHA